MLRTWNPPFTIHDTKFHFHKRFDLPDTPRYQIMTSWSNTPVPLSDDLPRNSTSDLATLNDFSVKDRTHIDNSSIYELRQAIAQSVGLGQQLLGIEQPIDTTINCGPRWFEATLWSRTNHLTDSSEPCHITGGRNPTTINKDSGNHHRI
jgi:hypothetical protein